MPHDVRELRIELIAEGFVVTCKCGWKSEPAVEAAVAVKSWQEHRDSQG